MSVQSSFVCSSTSAKTCRFQTVATATAGAASSLQTCVTPHMPSATVGRHVRPQHSAAVIEGNGKEPISDSDILYDVNAIEVHVTLICKNLDRVRITRVRGIKTGIPPCYLESRACHPSWSRGTGHRHRETRSCSVGRIKACGAELTASRTKNDTAKHDKRM